MGRYRLGDIIRMSRKSLSITQEQLCDEICSVETLSRIENGSQNPSRDTYELLMERMGRIRERAYSMLSVSDFKVLEKMKLFEDFISLYNYKQAETILNEIKEILGNSILDKQFLIRAESQVNYHMKRINKEEYLEECQKAIRLTIPRYGSISLANWPLNFNETVLLINISIALAESEEYNKAITILEDVYSAMNQSYMDEQQRIAIQVTIANNLSKWYGLVGKFQKAIEIANDGILLCKKHRFSNALPNLLYGVAWNKEQLINQGERSPYSKKECLSCLKQAYYISMAMQMPYIQQFILTHIRENYNDVTGIVM